MCSGECMKYVDSVKHTRISKTPCCHKSVEICNEALFTNYGIDMKGETAVSQCPNCTEPLVITITDDTGDVLNLSVAKRDSL